LMVCLELFRKKKKEYAEFLPVWFFVGTVRDHCVTVMSLNVAEWVVPYPYSP